MPSLQDLRRRVRSARNMQKITKSYKMVSAAKLRRAQDRVIAARPYANSMMRVLGRLAAGAGDTKHPLLEVRETDEHYVLALVTADRGLCAAFNSNLIKAAQQFIRENPDKQIDLVTIGRKGRDFFRRRKPPINEYLGVTAKTVDHDEAANIARSLMEMYTQEGSTVDRVFILYSEFKSVIAQRPVVKQLLPISKEALLGEPASDAGAEIEYLYEQAPEEIFSRLLPRYIETQVYYALLESVASEHGARMTAMDSASKNAGELIDSLTLTMNRVRQASITREIIEVVSGAQSLG